MLMNQNGTGMATVLLMIMTGGFFGCPGQIFRTRDSNMQVVTSMGLVPRILILFQGTIIIMMKK